MESAIHRRLLAARHGDDIALATLLRNEQSWLRSICCHLTRGDQISADDLVQETYLRFLESQSHLRCDSRPCLRAWLAQVARNLWRDHGFSNRLVSPMNGGHEPSVEHQASAKGSHWEELWNARRHLPIRQDLAVLLRDYCGCEFEVIAKILQCPTADAANSLRRRGLVAMARLFPLP